MAGEDQQHGYQLGVVGVAGPFSLLCEVELFGELLQQSVEVIEDYPEPVGLVVLLEVLPVHPIELFIGGFWSFEGAPIVAEHLTVPDNRAIPLRLLYLEVVLHSIIMTVQMYGLEVRSTGD